MSNYFLVEDVFRIKGKNIACISVPVGKVDKFPICVGDSLVNNDGEGVEVLELEWFFPSSIPTNHRSVAVVTDRMMERSQEVRLFKTVTKFWWEEDDA